MKANNLLPALGLLALTTTPFSEAVSGELLGYVDLDWKSTFENVNGGGVQRFSIASIDDTVGDTTDVAGILGRLNTAQGTGGLVYAICIENDEFLDKGEIKYALHRGLDGAPSATNDIIGSEAAFIDRVLTEKFGSSLIDKTGLTASDYRTDVRGLQALLWEAGILSTNSKAGADNVNADDFANGAIDMTANTSGGELTANGWLGDGGFPTLDQVTTYTLIANGTQQDFAFFLRDPDSPPGDTPVPAPATWWLIALGAFGARLMRRSA